MGQRLHLEPNVRRKIQRILEDAVDRAVSSGALALPSERPPVQVDLARQPEHGDFATGAAMALAKAAKRNPREIAQVLLDHLEDPEGMIESTEIAGPGFVNLRIKKSVWFEALGAVLEQGPDFGRSDVGAGRRVLVEYVSANPTGPLHVGHGRGAVTGDVIARLLDHAGYDVEREYYVNDAGHQVDMLAESLHVRYRELHGQAAELPTDGYPGDYVIDCARALQERDGDKWLEVGRDEWHPALKQFGIDTMLEGIKEDLGAFNVNFDQFTSEQQLRDDGLVANALDDLRERGLLFDEEGAVFFKSTQFGDDKDRAVVKSSGAYTYLAADIAYHREKLRRGFGLLVDVWGADHGGYIARMRAAIEALGGDPEALHVPLVQMVKLTRDGKPVKMGKRSGEFVTLREVIDEVGRDATRFFFIMRRSDAQFEFDLGLAKSQSLDNPVFYVQYGHARCAGVLRKAQEQGMTIAEELPDAAALEALGLPEEVDIAKRILSFPELIEGAARSYEPHRLVYYLQETIAAFHSYYTKYANTDRIVSDDVNATAGRVFVALCLKRVLKNGLDILGVDAPDRMEWSDPELEVH